MTNVSMHYNPDGAKVRLESGEHRCSLNIVVFPNDHMSLVAFAKNIQNAIEYQREHPGEPVGVVHHFNDPDWLLTEFGRKDEEPQEDA